MKELVVLAQSDQMDTVLDFVSGVLDEAHCGTREKNELLVAVEEIFVNIFSYAYPPKEGTATIRMEVTGSPAVARVEMIDQGQPYDPLKREDPDITLSAEERSIGGLGIFMVKQMMDTIAYRYENSSNILTFTKTIGQGGHA